MAINRKDFLKTLGGMALLRSSRAAYSEARVTSLPTTS